MLLGVVVRADAQLMEPRSYSNAPIGLNFASVGYGYLWGDVLTDPALPIANLEAKVHTAVIGYSRVVDVAGQSGLLTLVVPYAWLEATGDVHEAARTVHREGLADLGLRFSANLYGAPALSLAEFPAYRPGTIVGVSVLVTVPTGRYEADRLVNVGTNRWSFRPEIGASTSIGPWSIELAVGAAFFTENDRFLGDGVRRQDPLVGAQAHVIHDLGRGRWASLDATVYGGGRTTVNGVPSNDRQENTRLGATYSHALGLRDSIKFHASSGATARFGTHFRGLGLAWQHRWGAGL